MVIAIALHIRAVPGLMIEAAILTSLAAAWVISAVKQFSS